MRLTPQPDTIVASDFNHDGQTDLASVSSSASTVSVLLGSSTGVFQDSVSYAAGAGAKYAAIEDINADGNADIVATNSSGNGISILLGKGDGTFEHATSSALSGAPGAVAVQDFNGDGRPDIAVAIPGSDSVSLLSGLAAMSTSTTLMSSQNPSRFGENVTLTATISLPTATGVVTFFDGIRILGTGGVRDGQASLQTNLLESGSHSLTASYLGGTGLPSTSSVLTQTVNRVAQSGFLNAVNYGSGGSAPQSVAVGDFNADGKPDVAVANFNTHNVSVFLNQGGGLFASPLNSSAGFNPVSIATGDFNEDGKTDIVAVDYGSQSVAVLIGNGDGTFGTPVSYPAGNLAQSIAIADFNNDGREDLAVAFVGGVKLLAGNADGTFQEAVQVDIPFYPNVIVAGDFNGDGKPDFAVAGSVPGSSSLGVLLGKGDGTFQPVISYAIASNPKSLAIGDFNEDGKPDLAFENSFTNTVTILEGVGDGTFHLANSYSTGDTPVFVTTSDVDGDGHSDILIANSNFHNVTEGNTVSVLRGAGNGTFVASSNLPVVSGPLAIVPADFERNGLVSLAVSSDFGVSILLGKPPSGASSSSVTVATSANPSISGASLTITASVAPSAARGTVTFYDGTKVLGVGILTNGHATFTTALLLNGSHDIAVRYNGDSTYAAGQSAVFRQSVSPVAAQGFSTATTFPAGSRAGAVVVQDFNGDGRPDVAVGNVNGISIFLNNGGTSLSRADYTIPTVWVRGIASGDFNGDGKADLIASSDSNAPEYFPGQRGWHISGVGNLDARGRLPSIRC